VFPSCRWRWNMRCHLRLCGGEDIATLGDREEESFLATNCDLSSIQTTDAVSGEHMYCRINCSSTTSTFDISASQWRFCLSSLRQHIYASSMDASTTIRHQTFTTQSTAVSGLFMCEENGKSKCYASLRPHPLPSDTQLNTISQADQSV
jgi:hypothetical protein